MLFSAIGVIRMRRNVKRMTSIDEYYPKWRTLFQWRRMIFGEEGDILDEDLRHFYIFRTIPGPVTDWTRHWPYFGRTFNFPAILNISNSMCQKIHGITFWMKVANIFAWKTIIVTKMTHYIWVIQNDITLLVTNVNITWHDSIKRNWHALIIYAKQISLVTEPNMWTEPNNTKQNPTEHSTH